MIEEISCVLEAMKRNAAWKEKVQREALADALQRATEALPFVVSPPMRE
jgi:hypothetical protein